MDSLPDWAPTGVDLTRASAARMYDYYLGGAHNFGVDRESARLVLDALPQGQLIAQANRAFLHRVVRRMLEAGIRQFLDIGSGIPTSGNVHEIVQQHAPEARVLYVDHDPVAVAHSELILQGNPNASVLQGDFRRPGQILDSPECKEVLDLDRPVGLLVIAVLHFIPDADRPDRVLATLREALAPGSYLAISQGIGEGREAERDKAKKVYDGTAHPVTARTREDLLRLFDGWELVEPGVVWLPEWHPDWPDDVGEDPSELMMAGGLGRKP